MVVVIAITNTRIIDAVSNKEYVFVICIRQK